MTNIQAFPLKEDATWDELIQLPRTTPIIVEREEGGDLGLNLESRIKKICKEHLTLQGKAFADQGKDVENDHFAFECLWDQALANQAISWSEGKPLDAIMFRKIGTALEEDCIFKGEGISAQSDPDSKLHPLMEYLMGRNDLPNGMSGAEALAIFHEEIERDPVEACRLFQQELRQVLEKAAASEIPRLTEEPQREALFKMFVGHLIAALPFVYPNKGDLFPIPVKIEGQWVVKQYKVDERIELTPGPFSPLLAFGLIAQDNDLSAPPLLTFSGTTWGEGKFVSVLSDLTPFMSVGHVPYLFGQSKIDAWMNRYRHFSDVDIFGASLGGALCFHFLRNHSDRLRSVNVFNPPGLYSCLWNGPIDKLEVNIYLQQNDIVSTAGYFPTGSDVHVYRVVGEQSDGYREAHGRGYGGGKRVTLVRSTSHYENSLWKRTSWTTLLFVAGLTVGVALWTFFILACLYHVIKEKTRELLCCRRKWTHIPAETSEPITGVATGLATNLVKA
jgi:hypothetical protein